MKTTKILLILLLFTLFVQAAADRSIYRKKYGKENKVALVIGNGHYTHFSPLKNTLNDAEDMRKILKSKGFDVLYLPDGDLRSMERIVRVFSGKLKQGGVGFFYYAGHGIEVDHKNYLIPVGSEIPKKDEVKYEALPVDMVIDKMESAKNRLNIIVLDACRNDPFSRGGGGLAQINNAKGMYVAFATAPGEVASDGGVGKNGLFTKYLVRYIDQPNLTLDQIFNKTRISVYEESSEKQLPWTSSSVMGEFYFQPGGSAAANISSRKTNNIKLIHFSHPKKEPRGLYIAQIKVNDIEKRYRIYCPSEMVRDITNDDWDKARKVLDEDKIKYSGSPTIRQIFDKICLH